MNAINSTLPKLLFYKISFLNSLSNGCRLHSSSPAFQTPSLNQIKIFDHVKAININNTINVFHYEVLILLF